MTAGPTVLLVNAAAREGADAAEAASAALGARGVRVDRVRVVPEPAALGVALRELLALAPSRLLVGGGDGTLSAAANLLAGGPVALGVLPLGTGNDFARNLHIPRALEPACDVIAAGAVREVSVGVANGRVFLNALSLGLSSAVTARLTPALKRSAGPLAYPVAAAGEAVAPEPFRLALETREGRRELLALQVVVGNGRWHGGGTLVAPHATVDDDDFDLYAIEAAGAGSGGADRLRNVWVLARVALLLRRGRHLEHPGVLHLRCREVRLEADPPQEADADGEVIGPTPLDCRVVPRHLRVLAPARGAQPARERSTRNTSPPN